MIFNLELWSRAPSYFGNVQSLRQRVAIVDWLAATRANCARDFDDAALLFECPKFAQDTVRGALPRPRHGDFGFTSAFITNRQHP
jgi:hypothetical protein